MASNDASIPEGWWPIRETGANGKTCYKNELDQRFYSMKDLMRYVIYAKKAKLSIYAPKDESAKAKKSRKLKPKKKKPKVEVSGSSSENDSEA